MAATEIRRRSWLRVPRFRIGLRGMMIGVLLCGGALGWYLHRVQVQRHAVEVIEAAGGVVDYEWAITGNYLAGGTAKPELQWLVDQLGVDFLGNVTRVGFAHNSGSKPVRVTDDVLAEVGNLPYVRRVGLVTCDTAVTSAGVAHLGKLSRLDDLFLCCPEKVDLSFLEHLTKLEHFSMLSTVSLTNDDMEHVSRLTSLRSLHLYNMNNQKLPLEAFDDQGMKSLKSLVNIESLLLDGSRITTAGLASLRGMTSLHNLSLYGTKVDSLDPLKHLTGLRSINLNESLMSDTGLTAVAGFRNLDHLDLQGTPVGDAGLAHLHDFASLKTLDIGLTKVTDAGLAHLAGLPMLYMVMLNDDDVGDSGVTQLLACPRLRRINLNDTRVTDTGLAQLAAKPGLFLARCGPDRCHARGEVAGRPARPPDLALSCFVPTNPHPGSPNHERTSDRACASTTPAVVSDQRAGHDRGRAGGGLRVGVGWSSGRRFSGRRVEAIHRAQGWVFYDWEDPLKPPGQACPWPAWLVKTLGEDYFGRVIEVRFGNPWREPPPLTAECLARVADLADLKTLKLDFVAAPAAGLAHLRRLSRLERFSFISTNRAPVDLSFLEGMSRLRELKLHLPSRDRRGPGARLEVETASRRWKGWLRT